MHTNETTHFHLPVFVANDTPAWLVDWNGAMNDIDSALYSLQQGTGTISTDLATLQANLTTLEGIVESQGSSVSSLASTLTSVQGTVNTITSLIGNGEPTTTDKTLIGAINEINADVSQLNSDLSDIIAVTNEAFSSETFTANATTTTSRTFTKTGYTARGIIGIYNENEYGTLIPATYSITSAGLATLRVRNIDVSNTTAIMHAYVLWQKNVN